MYLKEQFKEIENIFAALKTDVLIAEPKGPERKKRLEVLTTQEEQRKAVAKSNYQEIQDNLKNAENHAKSLDLPLSQALQVLSYHELKAIHWHFDNPGITS